MHSRIDIIFTLIILANLLLLSSSRLGTCINVAAIQGLLLAVLTLATRTDEPLIQTSILILSTIVLKSIVFPQLLQRAIRDSETRREMRPYVGYAQSIVVGMVVLALSLWLGSKLPLPNPTISPLALPVALFTILVGLFLIVSRRKAVSQVLGYLVMENGIYVFGVTMVHESTLFVELGVLLDVFVGVFIMGIMIFHISREFDHLDVDRLSTLKD